MPFHFIQMRENFSAAVIAVMLIGLSHLAAASAAWAQGRAEWTPYKNPRFGYTLSYPSNVFEPKLPAEKSEGQSFVTADGRAKIIVYGAVNDENFTPAKYREYILREFGGYDQMDYSPSGKSWFVLSGFRGENIYYQKVMFSCGERIINVLSITFPRGEKKFYEGLIEVMEDSFKPNPVCG
jgi:hypothetical protein